MRFRNKGYRHALKMPASRMEGRRADIHKYSQRGQEQDACLEATSESACVTKETHSSLSEQARQALQAGQGLLPEIGWWLAWQTLLFTHVAQSCHRECPTRLCLRADFFLSVQDVVLINDMLSQTLFLSVIR